MPELDLTHEPPAAALPPIVTEPFNPDPIREETRGDLARGLLWLLTFAIGGVLFFVGVGRLEGTVITQSIFPSLIALAGTALGFYFGSQAGKPSDSGGQLVPTPSPGSPIAPTQATVPQPVPEKIQQAQPPQTQAQPSQTQTTGSTAVEIQESDESEHPENQ